MKVRFGDQTLAQLEIDPAFTGGYAEAIVRAFRKCMQVIRAADDERVVGQLQFRKAITYAHSREMLANIRDHITAAAPTDGWGRRPSAGTA